MAFNAAGANERPRPRDLSARASRLHCLVRDFVDEDLFFNLVDGIWSMVFSFIALILCRLFHQRHLMQHDLLPGIPSS